MNNRVEHPGVYLQQVIKEKGFNQRELSLLTDINETILSLIINGRRGINVKYAVQFEENLGVPAEVWLKKQQEYDIHEEKASLNNPDYEQ